MYASGFVSIPKYIMATLKMGSHFLVTDILLLMQKLILLLLLLFSSTCFSQSNSPWQCLDAELNKVRFFPKNNTVCIVGNSGCLLISVDSGTTWQQPFTGTLQHIQAIDFATPAIGVLVGFGGIISRTTDGGKSWKPVSSPTTNALLCIQFVSDIEGFAVGDKGTLLKTSDAGLTWKTMNFPFSFPITAISMDTPETGFIVGYESNILRTTDGGLHWNTLSISNVPNGNYYYQNCFRVNGKLFIFGGNIENQKGILLSSDDNQKFTVSDIPLSNDIAIVQDSIYTINTTAGILKSGLSTLQFTPVPLTDTMYPVVLGYANKNSLCFIGDSIVFAVGDRKFIYKSTSGMDSWRMVSYVSGYSYNDPISTKPDFFKVHFVNDSIGFLIGALRAIYHTKNGGATWLPQRSTSVALYNLHDITFTSFPNGLAVGSNASNSVVKTLDGGMTFIRNDTVNNGFVQVGEQPKIRFANDSLGFIIGSYSNTTPVKGLINLTYDGGKTWIKRFFDIGFTDGCWADSTTILICGGKYYFPSPRPSEGYIVISRDKGITWDSILLPFSSTLLGCYAINSNHLLVTGTYHNADRGYGLIFRSSDGGRTWSLVDSSDLQTMSALRFSTSSLGYTISRRLLQTKDGGSTWHAIEEKCPLDTGYFVRLAALPGGNVVITTSQPNRVLRSNFNNEVLSIEESKITEATVAKVWLTHPRPVPTSGKLQLDAIWLMNLDVSTIRIKLYDMLGIELQDISDSFHPNAGTNTGIVDFDGSKLPTGIYYIEINGGGYRKAVPVIISR